MADTNQNIWEAWVPETALAEVLAGEIAVADIGQVKGLWKRMLQKEVRDGRLVTWRGKWFPQAGCPHGLGPNKTCYGTPQIRDAYAQMTA